MESVDPFVALLAVATLVAKSVLEHWSARRGAPVAPAPMAPAAVRRMAE